MQIGGEEMWGGGDMMLGGRGWHDVILGGDHVTSAGDDLIWEKQAQSICLSDLLSL